VKKIILIFLLVLVINLAIVLIVNNKFNKGKQLVAEINIERKEVGMEIKSNAFVSNAQIPAKYTCQGDNINPNLIFSSVPENAKSLVLIVDDPDAPSGTFTHWVLFNMDPKIVLIEENSVPKGAVQGSNDAGNSGYTGPCPPSGTHHYFFKLYALDDLLSLSQGAKKQNVEDAMQNHIIKKGELIGLYAKK